MPQLKLELSSESLFRLKIIQNKLVLTQKSGFFLGLSVYHSDNRKPVGWFRQAIDLNCLIDFLKPGLVLKKGNFRGRGWGLRPYMAEAWVRSRRNRVDGVRVVA